MDDRSTATLSNGEEAIRALDEHWVELVAAKDIDAIDGLYALDAAFMVPNAAVAEGREAIAHVWRAMLGLPGFSLEFGPTHIEVARAGDMALDRGSYRLTTQGADGPVEDRGKYLVVWRKEGDGWRVAADMLNSDLPGATAA